MNFNLLLPLFGLFACREPVDESVFVPEEIDSQRMYDVVAEIASHEYGGRLPASEGNELALDYIEAVFDEIGLAPVGDDKTFRQSFAYEQWQQLSPPQLTIGGDILNEPDDFVLMEYSGSGTSTAELVFVGYGLTIPPFSRDDFPDCPFDTSGYDDYGGMDVQDKIALVLRYAPAQDEDIADHCPDNGALNVTKALWKVGYKTANAQSHGASALLMANSYDGGPETFQPSAAVGYDADFPAATVNRDLLEHYLPDLPTWADTIEVSYQPHSQTTGIEVHFSATTDVSDDPIDNLLGAVLGTDAEVGDEVIVIGAHIDHLGIDPLNGDIYPGADDNASGTAVLLELARMMTGSAFEPKRTVLFAIFNAEEEGLLGSGYYVGHPSFPNQDIVAMFSVDMVGAGNGEGIELYGGLFEDYTWLADLMIAAVEEEELPHVVNPREPKLASDHLSFVVVGATALLVQTSGEHLQYHTPQDTPDTNTADDLEAAAKVLWATLIPLAEGTDAL